MPSTRKRARLTFRALVVQGFIEKSGLETRRGRNRVCFRLTEPGKLVLDPRPVVRESPLKADEIFVPGLLLKSEPDESIIEILYETTVKTLEI